MRLPDRNWRRRSLLGWPNTCAGGPLSSARPWCRNITWLDTSRVRSSKYRPIYKWFFWLFVATCFALGYLGSLPAEGIYVMWARIFTFYYFAHFLLVMPIVGIIETPSSMPRMWPPMSWLHQP